MQKLFISIAATGLYHAHAGSTVVGVHVAHDGTVFYAAPDSSAESGDESDNEVVAAVTDVVAAITDVVAAPESGETAPAPAP